MPGRRWPSRRSGNTASRRNWGKVVPPNSELRTARRSRCMVVTALYWLLAVATSASAEGMWMLWVEEPAGSDNWSLAHIPEPKFTVKEDCERHAQAFNDLELEFA